jgi:RiboL-PSP-HEPN
MNLAILEDFKQETKQIREYMKYIQYSNNLASYTVKETDNEEIKALLHIFQSHDRQFKTAKKIFEYKAIIISLYGILEKYVEVWIKNYLNALSVLILDYRDLNDKIKDEHLKGSLKLLNILVEGRESTKHEGLKTQELLSNLHYAIHNHTPYTFNVDAFILSSGNLKHTKIVELLSRVEINLNAGLKKNETFNQYLKEEKGIAGFTHFNPDILCDTINDLVDRRNIIAHGGLVVDSSLDNNSILQSYVTFLEKYGQAIFEIISQKLLQQTLQQETFHHFQEITIKHKVWDKKTLGCAIANYTIQKGDWLIIKNTDDFLYKTRILELQIDNITKDQFIVTSQTDIAIRVEPPIGMGFQFYLRKQ